MASNEADIDDLVRRSFDDLPEIYRDACRGLGIRTELQASYKVMAAVDIADPYELLGLYHGVNVTQKVFSICRAWSRFVSYIGRDLPSPRLSASGHLRNARDLNFFIENFGAAPKRTCSW